MKNVVLIGASGFVGNAILKELSDRNYKVTAVVRDASKVKIINPNIEVVECNVEDTKKLSEICKGKDAVISAYSPGWTNPNMYEDTLRIYPMMLNAVKESGVKRFLVVGGAGTLFVAPGVRLVDSGVLPEAWIPAVKSLGEFYLNTLMNEKEIDWVFLSPAANLGDLKPGIRTGKYRTGKDDLLVDEKGNSFISVEDYAMAMVDELETPKHHQERFTVAY